MATFGLLVVLAVSMEAAPFLGLLEHIFDGHHHHHHYGAGPYGYGGPYGYPGPYGPYGGYPSYGGYGFGDPYFGK